MPLAVLPALAPDIPAVYDVYFSAFGGDIILNALFGGADVTDPKFRIAHSESTKEWWNHVSHQYTAKCVDTRTNEIVGMAIVELYLQERTEEEYKIPGAVWLEGEAREKAEAILRPLWDMREKLWGGRPYIYGQIMAVHPKWQRTGVGALLMSWGMNLADQLELPIYLEASKKGEGLYRKVGFETLKEKIVHRPEVTGMTEDIEVPLMVRMPSAAGGVTYEEWAKRGFPADYGLQDDYSNVTLRESRMQKMWRLCSGLLLCHKKRISTGQDSHKELK